MAESALERRLIWTQNRAKQLEKALNMANIEINKLQATLATTNQHLQVALAARSGE